MMDLVKRYSKFIPALIAAGALTVGYVVGFDSLEFNIAVVWAGALGVVVAPKNKV